MKFWPINLLYSGTWLVFQLILILICDKFSVNGQGIRGVIINNQKLDNSDGINLLVSNGYSTTSAPVSSTTPLTTKAPLTTAVKKNSTKHPNKLLVTINDFITQTPYNEAENLTKLPTRKPIFSDLNSIVNILNQNNSDFEKIDEIVTKLNRTGGLTQINVINVNNNTKKYRRTTLLPAAMISKNITYVHPYEVPDSHKDSKELKVQFVLDCDLKDALNKDKSSVNPLLSPNAVRPIYQYPNPVVKKQPILYPSYYQDAFNQRIPTRPMYTKVQTATRRPQYAVQFVAVTKKPLKTITKATPKPKIKNVYVDPPGVSAISNVFENFYNYFEEALTTNVIQKKSTKKGTKSLVQKKKINVPVKRKGSIKYPRHRPISKRSTIIDRNGQATESPEYRNTKAYKNNQKQHLTTQIHVTSEYVGKEPVTVQNVDSSYEKGDESDEYDDEYDDDDDEDDYYDSFDGFSFDDDDSESDEEGYEVSVENDYVESAELNKLKRKPHTKKERNGKKKKRHRKPVSNSYEDEYDERDDDDSSSDDDDYSLPNFGDFFSNMGNIIPSISNFMPSLPLFGQNNDESDYIQIEEGRATTPRMDLRRPKTKKTSRFSNSFYSHRIGAEEKTNQWYNKFFYGSMEDDATTTPITPSTTEASYFNWFGDSNEENVEATTISDQSNQNWLSGIFGGESTTRAAPSSTQSSLMANNPQQWLAMIASHMAATTKSPNVQEEIPKRVKYDDYQVWRVIPSTQAHLEYLREYKASADGKKIHWLKGPAMRGPTDILVPPKINKEVQEALEYESIPYDIVIWDLEKAIKYENPVMSRRQKIELEEQQGHPMTWYRYHDYEDIAIYVDYLQRKYPDLIELIHIGRSFEGRPLVVVKISFEDTEEKENSNHKKKSKASQRSRKKKRSIKPGVFIEGGVHGREWITPAVTTWILKELVKHNNTDDSSAEREIVRSVDWYILPVSNPDGYDYSLNYDRMWRKTRSKHPDNKSSMLTMAMNWLQREKLKKMPICYGTDPSRNFNTQWNMEGSSNSPCSDFYAGPKPFSEPETKALASFLDEYKKSLNLFLSLHSYGQMITYPTTVNSSYSETQKSNDLRDVAEIAVNALRDLTSSGRYSIDNTNEMLDKRTGTSTDFALHKIGIKYSYTIELRDTGTQGFLLSPSYIDTTGLETFEMIKAMVDYV